MNNHASRNILKVDAVSAPIADSTRNNFLVIYNVNVPVRFLEEEGVTRQVLERIKDLLMNDFTNYTVVYQITASYTLLHSLTGELRVWTGSFSVRDNAPAQLSGFEQFDQNTFVDDSLGYLEDAEQKLTRAPEFSSNWVLDSIIAVIFNVQCIVDQHNRILNLFPRDGRRAHRTFALP